MAGNKTEVDEQVSIALTCKYMGWDWQTYMNQPLFFIKTISMIRRIEAEENKRILKQNGNKE